MALATTFVASLGHAQLRVPSLDLRRFPTSTDPNASLYLEPAGSPGHLAWNVGVWGSYAHRLVTLDDESGDDVVVPVEHQLAVDYVASLGLTDRLAFGVVLPTVVYQSGDDTREALTDAEKLPTVTLGDLAFTGKATLLPPGDLGGISLALLGRATLPTGDTHSYVSESTATGSVRALGELSFVVAAVRASAGALFRRRQQNFAGLDFGHELPWALGLVFRPQILGIDSAGRWSWNLEARGALSLTPGFAERRESPAQLAVSARYAMGDFAALLGAEAPLADAVGAPAFRGTLAIGWAPRFPDVDGDGIGDEDDECAELAEDLDGFEDSDGCPDFDNDDDGVPDDEDKCPKELEDSDGFEDEDGCPDPDNDKDGVPDTADKCPLEAGTGAPGAEPGCPTRDSDGDGVPDAQDKCPAEPEDRDGHEDGDGCNDPDNDGDGVLDAEDACAAQPGAERSDPALNGCPNPDRDGDTFDDAVDRCPDEAEDFDGREDTDGCPDPGPGAPLASFQDQANTRRLLLARPLKFTTEGSLDATSEPIVRAIATLLNRDHDVVLLVAARPASAAPEAEQLALNRAFELANALRRFTHRDEAAETIGWSAIRKVPGAASGDVGFIVLSTRTKQ